MPHIIVLAGPNGAGKSTLAPELVRDALGVMDYVNADTIARGLSAYAPETAALEAGRVMLKRLDDLVRRQVSIPEEVIRRRYGRGIRNFFDVYQPLATTWTVYDNSIRDQSVLIARGEVGRGQILLHPDLWYKFCRSIHD